MRTEKMRQQKQRFSPIQKNMRQGPGFRATLAYLVKKMLAYVFIYIVTAFFACWLFSSHSFGEYVPIICSNDGIALFVAVFLVGLITLLPALILLSIFHAWRMLPDIVMVFSYVVLLFMLYDMEAFGANNGLTSQDGIFLGVAVLVSIPVLAFVLRWGARQIVHIPSARMELRQDLRASVKCMAVVSAAFLVLTFTLHHVQGYAYTNFDDSMDRRAGNFTADHPELIAKDWLLAASQGADIVDRQLDDRYAKDEGKDTADDKKWRELDGSIFAHSGGRNYRLIRVENVATQPSLGYKEGKSEDWLREHYIRMDVTYEDLSVPEAQRQPQTARIVGVRKSKEKMFRWIICPYGVIATTGVDSVIDGLSAINMTSLTMLRLQFGMTFDNVLVAFMKERPKALVKGEKIELSNDGHGPRFVFRDAEGNAFVGQDWQPVLDAAKQPVFLSIDDPSARYVVTIPGDFERLESVTIEHVYTLEKDGVTRKSRQRDPNFEIKRTKFAFDYRNRPLNHMSGMKGL